MKSIIVFLRHVITPLIFGLFLVLGLTAALLSGVVEYHVIGDLLSNSDASTQNMYIPLIIVFVLEGLKVFLHYIIPAHRRIGDTGSHIFFKNVTKYVLVIFSLICTLVFVSNSLYNPRTVMSSIDNEIQTIEAKYSQLEENGRATLKPDADPRVKNIEKKAESIRNQLDKLTPVYRPQSAYNNYVKEKNRLEGALEKAEQDYRNLYEIISKENETAFTHLQQSLSTQKQAEIDTISNRFEYLSSGDNPYLSSAIAFFLSVFGRIEYSRTAYFLCVLCIALIISVILELTISFSFSYVATNGDKLIKLFSEEYPIPTVFKAHANKLIKTIVQSSIMLSIYLIYQSIADTKMTFYGIIYAFFSYFLSIIFTSDRIKLTLNIGEKKEESKKVHNTIVDAKKVVFPVIVQTLICVVGFLMISVYMGYAIADLIPTTIALSVGSISGQVILQPKVT